MTGKSTVQNTSITKYYPDNDGALGEWKTEHLLPGDKVDRFGRTTGRYLSPADTPMNMRALPPDNSGAYNVYKVIKPFPVQSSTIAPAFGKIGLGKQYMSPLPIKILLKRGIIVPVNKRL